MAALQKKTAISQRVMLPNAQKKKTFEAIKQYDANTLTANKLIDILSALTSDETKYLFSVGVFDDEASIESNAATFIKSLFGELITSFGLEKIVSGELSYEKQESRKLVKGYKQAIFRKMVNDWQVNSYDEIKRKRLDHELWGIVFESDIKNFFPNVDANRDQDKSLSASLSSLLENNTEDDKDIFYDKLIRLNQACPEYMPELLAELTQRYCHSDKYERYLGIVLNLTSGESKDAQALSRIFLNCHQRLATDIVKKYSHKFFELDSAMQAKVHQDLLLEARNSYDISDLKQDNTVRSEIWDTYIGGVSVSNDRDN